MKRVVVLGCAVALALGCASARANRHAQLACPNESSVRLRADIDSLGPVPCGMFLPPLPPPADVRGNHMIARMVIDTTGWPMRDSITVSGITNAAYEKKILDALARTAFLPARRNGVAVRAPAQIGYEFR